MGRFRLCVTQHRFSCILTLRNIYWPTAFYLFLNSKALIILSTYYVFVRNMEYVLTLQNIKNTSTNGVICDLQNYHRYIGIYIHTLHQQRSCSYKTWLYQCRIYSDTIFLFSEVILMWIVHSSVMRSQAIELGQHGFAIADAKPLP